MHEVISNFRQVYNSRRKILPLNILQVNKVAGKIHSLSCLAQKVARREYFQVMCSSMPDMLFRTELKKKMTSSCFDKLSRYLHYKFTYINIFCSRILLLLNNTETWKVSLLRLNTIKIMGNHVCNIYPIIILHWHTKVFSACYVSHNIIHYTGYHKNNTSIIKLLLLLNKWKYIISESAVLFVYHCCIYVENCVRIHQKL